MMQLQLMQLPLQLHAVAILAQAILRLRLDHLGILAYRSAEMVSSLHAAATVSGSSAGTCTAARLGPHVACSGNLLGSFS